VRWPGFFWPKCNAWKLSSLSTRQFRSVSLGSREVPLQKNLLDYLVRFMGSKLRRAGLFNALFDGSNVLPLDSRLRKNGTPVCQAT